MSTPELHQGDATEWLRWLPGGSVNLVITDPPYASLDRHRAVGTTTRLQGGWFPTVPDTYYAELFRELYRVLVRHSHCYVFSDFETAIAMTAAATAAGFKAWKPLVWDRQAMGMGYHYRSQYELILFFEKGKRKLADLGVPNVLSHKRLRGRGVYPTQKPVPLLETLVRQSSGEGELVCDPFCGSGSTGVAAVSNRRRFIGCDIGHEALALTRDRIVHARNEQKDADTVNL